MFESLLMML